MNKKYLQATPGPLSQEHFKTTKTTKNMYNKVFHTTAAPFSAGETGSCAGEFKLHNPTLC